MRPNWTYLLLAVVLVGVTAWLLLDADPDIPTQPALLTLPAPAYPPAWAGPTPAPTPALPHGPVAPLSAASGAPAAAATTVSALGANLPAPSSDDLAAHVPPGQLPSMNEVIDRLHQAGIRTGLGAFNPPGTRPPLVGLAVPEDFNLPPGYLRHHQATDDGQSIEAVLMFDPDYPPAQAAGRDLTTTTGRVVPAELAPVGLPLRLITIPPPVEPGASRR